MGRGFQDRVQSLQLERGKGGKSLSFVRALPLGRMEVRKDLLSKTNKRRHGSKLL